MTKFLTLKHWQLIALFAILPVFIEFVLLTFLLFAKNRAIMYYAFPLLTIFFLIILFCWYYSLGVNLHKKLPAGVKMNVLKFKILLFIPVLYTFLFTIIVASFTSNFTTFFKPNAGNFLKVLPMHIIAIYCFVYCMSFIGKALKSVEIKRNAMYDDYWALFFLIWFFPVGIWIIQPRINKIFRNNAGNAQI